MTNWKKVNDNYEVNDHGEVRSLPHIDGRRRPWPGKVLKQFAVGKGKGYLAVSIAGKTVEFVNPAYTSQACSGCGSIYHKTLAERVHNCPDCGLVLDRDVNAAVNILHKSNLWAETVQDAPTYRDAECVASKAVCFS